jgi:hypothetical protein
MLLQPRGSRQETIKANSRHARIRLVARACDRLVITLVFCGGESTCSEQDEWHCKAVRMKAANQAT